MKQKEKEVFQDAEGDINKRKSAGKRCKTVMREEETRRGRGKRETWRRSTGKKEGHG
jgi:hypothetical protein